MMINIKSEMKNCPFHGCRDVALIKKDGFAFVIGLKCGVRGSPYALKHLGDELAIEMAIDDWNARESVL